MLGAGARVLPVRFDARGAQGMGVRWLETVAAAAMRHRQPRRSRGQRAKRERSSDNRRRRHHDRK
eukprot:15479290-Alexandrium_andersonii.AAC.1